MRQKTKNKNHFRLLLAGDCVIPYYKPTVYKNDIDHERIYLFVNLVCSSTKAGSTVLFWKSDDCEFRISLNPLPKTGDRLSAGPMTALL